MKTGIVLVSMRLGFVETMNYNSAVYESIDVVLPRDHKERINEHNWNRVSST
jgi:hypothetical protein